MFVGWEGVGICSYLLVNFWFTRIAANQSSISAFLTNRVGDCFLTIGMFITIWSFGNLDYATVFSVVPYINENIIILIGICLLIGAMAKSSQIGLHIWLPQAMEGPTPVSALIHAATMVTAGVYLLMRSSPLIEYSSTVLISCLWIGAITTIFSSMIGLFQQDIKKVIAYSTMSQLGMMVIAIGLSSYNIALFHLINHAFYKALLFLGAGAVIHAVSDNQDFRKYGGLKEFLPLSYSVMLIASLSLVAFPFMTGFYSKDFILESAYGQFTYYSNVVYYIATIGAIFTCLYSIKILYLTFLANPNGSLHSYKNAHESNVFMSMPLFILAILSVFFGYIFKDIYIGLGSPFFIDNGIFIHPLNEIMVNTEFAVTTFNKLLPLILTVSFSIVTLLMLEYFSNLLVLFKLSRLIYNIFSLFNSRLLFEYFYNKYVINIILNLGGQTTKILDKGSVELLGPYGLEKILTNLSNNLSKLDTGVVTSYALYILIAFSLYLVLPYLEFINILLILAIINLFINKLFSTSKSKLGIVTQPEIDFSKRKLIGINLTSKRYYSTKDGSKNNQDKDNWAKSEDGDYSDTELKPPRLPHERPGFSKEYPDSTTQSEKDRYNRELDQRLDELMPQLAREGWGEDSRDHWKQTLIRDDKAEKSKLQRVNEASVSTVENYLSSMENVEMENPPRDNITYSADNPASSTDNPASSTDNPASSTNNPAFSRENTSSSRENKSNDNNSNEKLSTPTEFVANLEQTEMPYYTDPED